MWTSSCRRSRTLRSPEFPACHPCPPPTHTVTKKNFNFMVCVFALNSSAVEERETVDDVVTVVVPPQQTEASGRLWKKAPRSTKQTNTVIS